MNSESKQLYEKEAFRIGDEILSLAKKDKNGLAWLTMDMDLEQNVTFTKSESIYGGGAGIVLFLVELFKRTNDVKYLETAVDATRWVYNSSTKKATNNYSFITGRLGISFTLLKMHEITKEHHYLKKALDLARDCDEITLSSQLIANDLIGGISSIILGLLHLHSATGEQWLLKKIDIFIERLIENAFLGEVGLYWGRSGQNIRGLAGFAHGAAGIGLVFLELGFYFNNDTFFHAAEQAFAYESYHFDKQINNWPDFRKGNWNNKKYKEFETNYLEDNILFFTKITDMNAWCHGAAGIGLSRLRAYSLLEKQKYKKDVSIAIEKTIKTDVELTHKIISNRLFILCHGAGGNAELFIEAYNTFQDNKYLSYAINIANSVIYCRKKYKKYISGFGKYTNKEDIGLYLGNAGIGYFLLRLTDPKNTPSVLNPTLNASLKKTKDLNGYPNIAITLPELKKKTLDKSVKRTIYVLNNIVPEKLEKYYSDNYEDPLINQVSLFITFIKNLIKSLPQNEKDCISDLFRLELRIKKIDDAIKSHAFITFKYDFLSKHAAQIINRKYSEFTKLKFILNPDITIMKTKWNWSKQDANLLDNLSAKPDVIPVLIKSTEITTFDQELSLFTYTILNYFQSEAMVGKVLQNIIKSFEINNEEQINNIKEQFLIQIKELLLACILIDNELNRQL